MEDRRVGVFKIMSCINCYSKNELGKYCSNCGTKMQRELKSGMYSIPVKLRLNDFSNVRLNNKPTQDFNFNVDIDTPKMSELFSSKQSLTFYQNPDGSISDMVFVIGGIVLVQRQK